MPPKRSTSSAKNAKKADESAPSPKAKRGGAKRASNAALDVPATQLDACTTTTNKTRANSGSAARIGSVSPVPTDMGGSPLFDRRINSVAKSLSAGRGGATMGRLSGNDSVEKESSGGSSGPFTLLAVAGIVLAVVGGGAHWALNTEKGDDAFVFHSGNNKGKGTDSSPAPFYGSCGCYDASASRKSPLLRQLSISKKGFIAGAIAEKWGSEEDTLTAKTAVVAGTQKSVGGVEGTSYDGPQTPTTIPTKEEVKAVRSNGNGGGKKGFNQRLKAILGITSSSKKSSQETKASSTTQKKADAVQEHHAVHECVRFYTLPTRMETSGELAAFLRKSQDPARRCHVWLLDDVVNTTKPSTPEREGSAKGSAGVGVGWSQHAWNALKELFDHQTIQGEGPILADENHVGLVLVRSGGDAKSLEDLGMPARVGFTMSRLKSL